MNLISLTYYPNVLNATLCGTFVGSSFTDEENASGFFNSKAQRERFAEYHDFPISHSSKQDSESGYHYFGARYLIMEYGISTIRENSWKALMEILSLYLIILKKQLRNMKSCIMKDIAKRLENKKISSLLIVLCVFCFKCNAQNNNMLYVNDSIESHILRGDSNAYNILSEKVYGINLLPYALIMAGSYNYGLACYDIYTIIIEEMHDKNNLSIDSLLLEAAINYLIKGADLNNWNCCIELSYLYEKGLFVEQSDQKSLMYLERAKRVKVKYIIEHDESGEKE